MYTKFLAVTALAAGASAQNMSMGMNLTQVLGANPMLSNLTSYVSAFPSLTNVLGSANNVTILAPSNDAFAKFMKTTAGAGMAANSTASIEALLLYHVLNGTYPSSAVMPTPSFFPTMLNQSMYTNVTMGQFVEGIKMGDNVTFYSGLIANSTVTQADTNFTGGVVHVIDNVLTLPQSISDTAVAAGLSGAVGALTKANLAEPVNMLRDVTVFVPNNMAFEAIGSSLPNMTTQQLASILQYHVVNGTVGYSSSLVDGMMLQSMNGANLTIKVQDGNIFVNSAKVVTPNVLVANGVVHVIDNVLNPNNTMAMPNPTATMQSAAFTGASMVSSLALTSGVPTPTTTIGSVMTSSSMMSSAPAGGATSSSKKGAAAPMKTGAVGAAALFAGAGVWLNA